MPGTRPAPRSLFVLSCLLPADTQATLKGVRSDILQTKFESKSISVECWKLTRSPAARAPRRERHKAATRRRLYEAAMALFAEKGYEGTSIEDIAERADVARATVFNYFKRKDQFLTAWGDERRRSLDALVIRESARGASAQEQLRRCMSALAAANEAERHLARTLTVAWVRVGGPLSEEPYTAYIFGQIVMGGIMRREIRPDVDSSLVGNILRDVYLGTLYRWLGAEPDPAFSLAEALLASLDVLLEGLVHDRRE